MTSTAWSRPLSQTCCRWSSAGSGWSVARPAALPPRCLYSSQAKKTRAAANPGFVADIDPLEVFIPPTGKNRPPWTHIGLRLKVALKTFIGQYVGSTLAAAMLKRVMRPRKINWTLVKADTISMWEKMNEAFARGRINEVQPFCSRKLAKELQTKIGRRPRAGQKVAWRMVELLSTPKFVSIKAFKNPMNEMYLGQAVVRIHARQEAAPTSNEEGAHVKTFDSTEYVVVQSKQWDQPGKWTLVGMMQESIVTRKAQATKEIEKGQDKALLKA